MWGNRLHPNYSGNCGCPKEWLDPYMEKYEKKRIDKISHKLTKAPAKTKGVFIPFKEIAKFYNEDPST